MSDPLPPPPERASPPRRFTLRLIDGHFVRVPALGVVSINGRHRPDGVQMLRAMQKAEGEQEPEAQKTSAASFTAIPPSFSPRYKSRKPAAET